MKTVVTLSVAVVLAYAARAAEPAKEHKEHMAAGAPASKEFQMIKGLVGGWKGAADMDGRKVETTTSFRLTSAGSAVVETMGAGTDHEMTNVYHDVDGKLMMTHYCSVGNAPRMKAGKTDGTTLNLSTVAGNGIDPKKTPHMHGVSYVMADKDHLKATWTSANMGKEHEAPAVFEYTRAAR